MFTAYNVTENQTNDTSSIEGAPTEIVEDTLLIELQVESNQLLESVGTCQATENFTGSTDAKLYSKC